MREYSRRDVVKGLGGLATTGLAGCSSQNQDTNDETLLDIIDGIEYDQKQRIQDYNNRLGTDEKAFNEDSLTLETDPEQVLESSGDINYEANFQTNSEGEMYDMTQLPENYGPGQNPVASMLAEIPLQTLWFPVKNAQGGSFGYEEAGEEFRERLGNITAKVQDHAGNTAELTMSQSTAEEYWTELEENHGDEEALEEISSEIHDWAAENIQFS